MMNRRMGARPVENFDHSSLTGQAPTLTPTGRGPMLLCPRLSTALEAMDALSAVEWAPGPLSALLEGQEVEV